MENRMYGCDECQATWQEEGDMDCLDLLGQKIECPKCGSENVREIGE